MRKKKTIFAFSFKHLQLFCAVAQIVHMYSEHLFGFIPFWAQIIDGPNLINDINDALEF